MSGLLLISVIESIVYLFKVIRLGDMSADKSENKKRKLSSLDALCKSILKNTSENIKNF